MDGIVVEDGMKLAASPDELELCPALALCQCT